MNTGIKKLNSKIFLSILSIILAVSVYLFILILEKKADIKLDYSYGNSTSYSEITAKTLENLRYPVQAYVISDEAASDQTLMSLLERFEIKSKNFIITKESIYSNPLLLHKMSDSLNDSGIDNKSLILFCEKTGRTRILSSEDFVFKQLNMNTNSMDVLGIQYEKSIIEAIVYLVSDELPVIQRLIGHDEIDDNSFQALSKLLKEKYYEIRDIDLSRNDSLADNGILLILSPRKDFSENEFLTIKKYIDNGGKMIITSDYNSPDKLENFNKILEYYGIKISSGIVVSDSADTASYYKSPIFLLPYMQNNEFTSDLISNGRDKLMLAGSRAFEKIDSISSVSVFPLLKSGKAFIRPFKGDNTDLIQTENDVLEEKNLAFLSRRFAGDGKVSHAVIIGNSPVLLDEWLFQNTFSIDFLMQILNYFNPNSHSASLEIEPKYIVKTPMIINNLVFSGIILLIPVLLVGVFAVYLVKRRKIHER